MIHEKIFFDVPYGESGCKRSQEKASMVTYILDDYTQHTIVRYRPAIVICPGGGYEYRSEREAEAIALQFTAMGYHVFIVQYSVKPDVYPAPQLDLAKAVSIIREHAQEWHVEKDKIVLCGFSAGGHLAGSLGTLWKEPWLSAALSVQPEDIQPNGLILCYPVISSGIYAHKGSFQALLGEKAEENKEFLSLEKRVTKDTPRTFIWHTLTDGAVPVQNSILFMEACIESQVPVEFHMFPEGGHGLALANEETSILEGREDILTACQMWIPLVRNWLKEL
ncbi:alpha/beta hydrolase [Anaeromicropila populeti]|uniref:Acetyl esterase/lipase n=1 Tax=Anaeromicropila populeti TaxID=37658 RepID=A0A1I6IBD3_9FIRM|nr:alpha/beta hydrolase [Anaeromicropila populeti]SFR63690.1 Acetyl esterase/lipase [Anaeromicropila populeti]